MQGLVARLWRPVAAAALVHLLFLAVYLAKHHGDPSVLVCAGSLRTGFPPYEYITQTVGPSGHDGQFYYSLARAPWRSHGRDIDVPAGRHLRIFYPALCWLTSAGNPRLLFYVMPAVNFLAIVSLAALGAWLAVRQGRSPWWGFVLPLGANLGLTLLHNFTDGVSTVAVFALLAAWLSGARWHWIALAALLAIFSREQNLAVVGLIALAAPFRGRLRTAGAVAGVLALWGGWVCLLRLWYGCWPFITDSGQFEAPFAGMWYRWSHLGGNEGFSRRLAIIHAASMIHLLFLLGVAFVLAWRQRNRVLALAMLGGVTLAIFAGHNIYMDFWSYNRVFVWVPLGIWLGGLQTGQTWSLYCLCPGFLWSGVAALNYV
jgi:hypothetical protein